jgi:hypothetical protein
MATLKYSTIPKRVNLPRSQVDMAYLAGIIDGEGSFMISKTKNDNKRGQRSIWFSPVLSITNTNFELILWIVHKFGSNWKSTWRSSPKHKAAYTWDVVGHRACVIARKVMPFLIIKQLQAYLVSSFEYEALWTQGGHGKAGDSKTPESELIRRELLYNQIKECNKRGVELTDG